MGVDTLLKSTHWLLNEKHSDYKNLTAHKRMRCRIEEIIIFYWHLFEVFIAGAQLIPFTNINKDVLNYVSSLSSIPVHFGRAILQTCLIMSHLGCFLNLNS